LLGQLRHLRDLLPNDNKLPLSLLELKVDHPDLFLLLSNLLLSIFQNVLLDVALFIQDAKLIIFVDQLDTHVVSRLTSHLILEDQIVHLFLEGVDDQVQFVTFVNFLTDDAHPVFVKKFILVQVSSEGVPLLDLSLNVFLAVSECSVLFRGLIPQNFNFVHENFDSLLHFCEILR